MVPSGKKVSAIVSRGAPSPPDSPIGAMDFQVPYREKILGFIGLRDVTFRRADKQGFASETARESVDRAIERLSAIAQGCEAHMATVA